MKKETVRGYVAPEGGVVNVAASRTGVIARIFVEEGQHVRAGAPLIEFSGESVGTDTGQVLAAQMGETDRQIGSAKTKLAASASSLRTDAQKIQGQIKSNASSRALLVLRREDKVKLMAMLTDELARYEKLEAQGYPPIPAP